MKLVSLIGKYGAGKFTKVSDEDYAFVRSLKLHVSDQGYVKTYYQGRHRPLHQLIAGKGYDHANLDKLDNTRENLRPATKQQQNANVAPRAKSGFKGVSKDPSCNSYKANISVDGKMVHLGNFKVKVYGEEGAKHLAALVVDLWERDLHGEFARLNFPSIGSELKSADAPAATLHLQP